jgi:hypothetical protein
MSIVFKAVNKAIPIVGDLIRSYNTWDHINIVLEVVKEKVKGDFVYVRSVRWMDTNGGEPVLKYGKRSRWIKMGYPYTGWSVVEAVREVKVDDFEARMNYINLMDGVDTTYREKRNGHRNITQGA